MNHHHKTGGTRLLFFIINLLFLTCGTAFTYAASADDRQAPVTEITHLMEKGQHILLKPGAERKDIDSVLQIADRMEAVSKQLQDEQGLGLSKLLRVMALREDGHPEKGRPFAREAVDLLGRSGSKRQKADAILELGSTYSNSDPDLLPKIALYEQGIAIYQQLGNKMKEATLLEVLGDLYLLKQELPTAMAHLNRALALYKDRKSVV